MRRGDTGTMDRLTSVELRRLLSDVLDRVQSRGERIVIKRRGRDVAALISMEDLRLFVRLIGLQEDRLDVDAARAARGESDELIPFERALRELGLG